MTSVAEGFHRFKTETFHGNKKFSKTKAGRENLYGKWSDYLQSQFREKPCLPFNDFPFLLTSTTAEDSDDKEEDAEAEELSLPHVPSTSIPYLPTC